MKNLRLLCLSVFLLPSCAINKNVQYYSNGNKKYQEKIEKNHFTDKRTWWFENGQKEAEAYYDKEGVLIRIARWDSTGNLLVNNNLRPKEEKTDLSYLQWDNQDSVSMVFLSPGAGSLPSENDTITLHYIGYFEDGRQFDNSYDRKKPLSFVVGNNYLLKSFAESIKQFKEGQQGFIRIPPLGMPMETSQQAIYLLVRL
jgi:hypothetical protein